MRNNLVPSFFIVFIFWWIALSFKWLIDSLFNKDVEPFEWAVLTGHVYITGMSVFWGLLFASGLFMAKRLFLKSQVVGEKLKGISVSLGPFPNNRKKLPRIKRVTVWHPKMNEWINVYRDKYPKHLSLLNAAAEVLDAHPLHPASIEPGGHGDRTLVDHSHFVAEFMMKGAATYEYRGLKEPKKSMELEEKSGKEERGRTIDPLFKFNPNDPLIPIVGLVHDLGKLECYEVNLAGLAIEKRSKHDWRGKFVLTGLPEFWELSALDQECLLDVVGFYHHPWELPSGVSERSRAMIELVMKSDIEAGEYESAHPRMATKQDIYEMVKRMLEAKGANPHDAELPDRDMSYETELSGVKLSLHQSRILYYFEEMMFDDNAVNGGDIRSRLGFMIGKTIYFNEEAVRIKLGALLGAKKLTVLQKVDSQHVLTTDLMTVLALRGALVNIVNEHEFSPARSLFKVVSKNNDEKNPKEFIWPAIFMVNANIYDEAEVDKIAPIDHQIVSVNPVYGWTQAKKIAPKKIAKKKVVISIEGPKASEENDDIVIEKDDIESQNNVNTISDVKNNKAKENEEIQGSSSVIVKKYENSNLVDEVMGDILGESAPSPDNVFNDMPSDDLGNLEEDLDSNDQIQNDKQSEPENENEIEDVEVKAEVVESVEVQPVPDKPKKKSVYKAPIEPHNTSDEENAVLNGLHDAGALKQAESVHLALEAGQSIPLPSPKKSIPKRDQRRLDKIKNDEKNPVETNLWWEKNHGKDGAKTIIENMMVSRGRGKDVKLNGIDYEFFDIDDLMKINKISVNGREKFLDVITRQEEFEVSKKSGSENDYFVGIKKSLLEIP